MTKVHLNRRVILAGGGHAHLAVLADWIRNPLPDAECWLITPSRYTAYSGMLPGWIAGYYDRSDMFIDLAPLAERAKAKLIVARVQGLDADERTLHLSTGERIGFDTLSIGIGGETDTSFLASLGEKLLPVRPLEQFVDRWSAFMHRAEQGASANVAIVGGGAAGIELALAIAAAMRRLTGNVSVRLVAPEGVSLDGHAARSRRLAAAIIAQRGISIHRAQAAGTRDGLLLSTGEHVAADLVIAATGSKAPAWIARSGLAHSPEGLVSVGSTLRSVSHEGIFAAGDVIQREDRSLERSGVHAVKAGPILAHNLRESSARRTLKSYDPPRRSLYLISTGDRRAILSWGSLAARGRVIWHLKDHIDRTFVGHYRALGAGR